MEASLSDLAAQVLAERAYPSGPSGFCSSAHASEYEQVRCTVCYPDLWALIGEHDRLKRAAWRAGDKLAAAVRGLDSYAALGGAPMERTERADNALKAWEEATP